MSVKGVQINAILPSSVQNWTDLNKDGKRLEKVIKLCFRRVKDSEKKNTDPQVVLGYIAAMLRATHEKRDLVTTVLGVKQALEEYKKK